MRTKRVVFDNLAQFVDALRADGDLAEITAPVDRELEIAEIADRCVKSRDGGPALLFTNVRNSRFPVLINAVATQRRMARALGADSFEPLVEKIRGLIALVKPGAGGTGSKLAALWQARDLAGIAPKIVTRAPCQEVVERGADVDLAQLPIITCWPKDGGPFITLPLVFTKNATTGAQNVGVYRMQVYDRATTGMHWQRHKHGREHQAAGATRMPVAAAIGADPATAYAATAPLPSGFDEMLFAGFLRGGAVRMVRCVTSDLTVPAEAEFVLEGYVEAGELREEGPFGDHTGVYTPPEPFPVFHVTCITRRRKPLYWTTIVGRPPMEDAWLGKATERLFLPLLQEIVPEIVDYDLPVEGGFHNLAVVAIRKRYPGQAKKVMYALWGLGHMMMLTRNILVVDADVDVHDMRTVAWAALNNVDAGRDLVYAPGPVDDLDHAAPLPALGTKLGIDATRKGADEGYMRPWPEEIAMSAEVKARVAGRWREFGLDGRVPL